MESIAYRKKEEVIIKVESVLNVLLPTTEHKKKWFIKMKLLCLYLTDMLGERKKRFA